MSLETLAASSQMFVDTHVETKLRFESTETDQANNVEATVDKVMATCGSNVQLLICGSFYFMGDAKNAIERYLSRSCD